MQQSDTEKNAGHERQSHLHSQMRQLEQERKVSPQHGGKRDQDAVDDEKPEHEEKSRYERMNVQMRTVYRSEAPKSWHRAFGQAKMSDSAGR